VKGDVSYRCMHIDHQRRRGELFPVDPEGGAAVPGLDSHGEGCRTRNLTARTPDLDSDPAPDPRKSILRPFQLTHCPEVEPRFGTRGRHLLFTRTAVDKGDRERIAGDDRRGS